MRLLIITQDDPFYLSESLKNLINLTPKKHLIVGCVVNSVSPFGKSEGFIEKAFRTYKIFGVKFFLYYSMKFIISKLNIKNSLNFILKKNNIQKITLKESFNHKKSIDLIKKYSPDLLISILGNQIFKNEIINLASKGCINLHTALLPKYRGLMPTFWAMKNKEKYTGVSVFYVDDGIDTGPIIIQKKLEIGDRTQAELIKYTKMIGVEAIVEAIKKIDNGNVQTFDNNDDEMSYFSFPTKEDVKIFKNRKNRFF